MEEDKNIEYGLYIEGVTHFPIFCKDISYLFKLITLTKLPLKATIMSFEVGKVTHEEQMKAFGINQE